MVKMKNSWCPKDNLLIIELGKKNRQGIRRIIYRALKIIFLHLSTVFIIYSINYLAHMDNNTTNE